MIVRKLDDIPGTPRDRQAENWSAGRLLLREDGMGFSFSDNTCDAGAERELEYKNHLEANYVIEGEAELTDLATGRVYDITPGTMFALDKNDRHRLRAKSDMRFICVFCPAIVGTEMHDEDGSYPLI